MEKGITMTASRHRILTIALSVLTVLKAADADQSRGRINAFFQKSCGAVQPNPCAQECIDIKSGGFYCQCRRGYAINGDGMTCTKLESYDGPSGVEDGHVDFVHHGLPEVEEEGSNSYGGNQRTFNYNKDGEMMVSANDAISIHSVDMLPGLPSLQSDTQRRVYAGNDDTDVTHSRPDKQPILDHVVYSSDFYNIPEGGQSGREGLDIAIKPLDISEGSVDQLDLESLQLGDNLIELPSPFTGEEEEEEEKVAKPTCDNLVCHNNGTCAIMENRPVCLCNLGHFGSSCEREVEVRYPRFLGTGYLALPVLRDAHKEFTVRLEFKPASSNGLVLFSGELSDARTDFFSLVLEDGFAVLRFDCGTGLAELRSPERVQLTNWNTVVLTRVDNQATLRLNNGHQVEGSSKGAYTRITFRLPLYLGGYDDMQSIVSRVGTGHQFEGCVQELDINGHRFDFRPSGLVGEAEFGINVGECSEGVCDQVNCLNGGECTARSADSHICLCPLGFYGDTCEKDTALHIPHFSGHSYLELPSLQRSVLSYTELEVILKPTSHDGTILYNGFSRDRRGDFISLALEDSHIVFRFDLGTGPAELRSLAPVSTNRWHLVRAWRTGPLGTLQVDDQPAVTAEAQGAYTQLTLLDALYLGGHPNFDHTSKHARASHSFSGCLQKVVINKQTVKMLDGAVRGVNVGPCSHPCAGRPCMNEGQCKPRLDSYTCHCPLGFSNTNCEDAQSFAPTKPMFSGESYLMYTDKEITKRVSGNRMDLQLYIRPTEHDGLIFWSGEDQLFTPRSSSSFPSSLTSDFLALGFSAGSLQLRYNLGSGEALIGYNNTQLFDGDWHFVRVQRNKQDAYMEIDNRYIVEGSSPGGYTSLNTNKVVYLGGMPDVTEVTGGWFKSSFHGCIRSMKLATDYDVKLLGQAHTGVNVEQCRKKKMRLS